MRGVSGITGAGPIFRAVMTMLAEHAEPAWFEMPDSFSVKRICPLSGKTMSEQCSMGIEELFVCL